MRASRRQARGGSAITTSTVSRPRIAGRERSARAARANAASALPGSSCDSTRCGPRGATPSDVDKVERALLAHLCRCTGWRTIIDAWGVRRRPTRPPRDLDGPRVRATHRRGAPQRVGPEVALGGGGFADDTAPADVLVAVPDGTGGWVVGDTLSEARRARGEDAGAAYHRRRRSIRWPCPTVTGRSRCRRRGSSRRTSSLDASWCAPGGEPSSPLANGGAFGGKVASPSWPRRASSRIGTIARCACCSPRRHRAARSEAPTDRRRRRSATVGASCAWPAPRHRRGDHVVRAGGSRSRRSTSPARHVVGRCAAGWAEAALLLAGGRRREPTRVRRRRRTVRSPRHTSTTVACTCACGAGDPLDEVVLRSYCIGAAHMALGWVTSEGIAVADDGESLDLTIRSFGVLRPSTRRRSRSRSSTIVGATQRQRRRVRRGGGGGLGRARLPPDDPDRK